MAAANPQTVSTGETATSSSNPAWLDFIENIITEEKDDYFGDSVPFEIIRDLLVAPDEDDSAITTAVKSVQKDYVAGFSGKGAENKKSPEYDAGIYLNEISRGVFGCVCRMLYTDTKHEKLAAFLIALKNSAAQEFDLKEPQFVYYSWGLAEVANREWNACRVSSWAQEDDVRQQADQWVSLEAFLAKLFKGGLLPTDGPLWLFADFRDTFEKNSDDDFATSVGRQAHAFGTANHVLIAGEALVKEVKSPSQKWWFEPTKEKWILWASKLQEVASTVGEDAPWGLKARAQEAHDKMVELYPEAFTESHVISEQG